MTGMTTMEAGTAYLQLAANTVSSNVKAISFALIHGTVGIDEVKEKREEEKSGAGAVYDLSGHRIASLQQGVNIVRRSDGTIHKVVVK